MSPDMTGQNAQPKGWRGQMQKVGQTANTALAGWRGDGSSVPGNQPGGANGQFGRYGQTPDMQPTPAMHSHVAQQAQNDGGMGQMAANAVGAVQGIQRRYGAQGRMDHAMNQNQQQMHQQGMQASADQLQQPQDQAAQSYGQGADMPDSPNTDQGRGGWNDGKSTLSSMDGGGTEPWKQQGQDSQQSPQQNVSGGYIPPSVPFGQNAIDLSRMGGQQQPQSSQGSDLQAGTNGGGGSISASSGGSSAGQNQAATQPAQPQSSTMDSPFGKMNFGGAPQMADGRIVTKPTRAIIGEAGPEAVIPLDGHASSKITPESVGMAMPRRYDATGTTSLHHPMRPMRPMGQTKASGWKRWDSTHPQHG